MTAWTARVGTPEQRGFLPISIWEHERTLLVGHEAFRWSLEDEQLASLAAGLLPVLQELSWHMVRTESLTLPTELCQQALADLALWGQRATRLVFEPAARSALRRALERAACGGAVARPTVLWDKLLFPWEVLFDDEARTLGNPEGFWGLRHAPARSLHANRGAAEQNEALVLPTDMLFAANAGLLRAHQEELPALRSLLAQAAPGSRLALLGGQPGSRETIHDGKDLLRWLDQASYGLLHFACHCEEAEDGTFVLSLSLCPDDAPEEGQPISLETFHFVDSPGHFSARPLVFLNACQSSGRGSDLAKVFNFPRMFVDRGAQAVIATVCPVPDRFAAAFAEHFYRLLLLGDDELNPLTGQVSRRPLPLAEALRQTRRHFLDQHNNPLGLAYGLYSPVQVQRSPTPLDAQARP